MTKTKGKGKLSFIFEGVYYVNIYQPYRSRSTGLTRVNPVVLFFPQPGPGITSITPVYPVKLPNLLKVYFYPSTYRKFYDRENRRSA